MPYMLMILEPRGRRAARRKDEAERLCAEMMAFAADLRELGLLLRAGSLCGDGDAVRVSAHRDGAGTQMLGGPFAEAEEMVDGYFLVDVASRDEAVAIASGCPAIRWATVEVRECLPCQP